MADKKISALTAATTPLAGTEVLPIVQSSATVKVSVADLTTGREVNAYRLITTGEVAIGTTNTGYGKLGVFDTTNALLAVANSTSYAQLQQNGGDLYVNTNAAGAGSGNLIFRFGGAFTTRASINGTSGDITANTGNLVIGTAGKGIDFSANGGDVLTQYDEGDWTPTDTSGAGLSLTINYAKYTRIGRAVFINAFITYPSTASIAAAALGGLPFTVGTGNYAPLDISSNSGLALASYVNSGGTTLSIGLASNNSTAVQNVSLAFKNVVIGGVYFV